MYLIYAPNELAHYGILGQKWGIRRFQNPDGTLTEAGKKRYGTVENLEAGKTKKQAEKYEEAKKKAINSGKTEEVQKFSKDLTAEEMKRAFERIDQEQKLTQLRNQDIVLGKEKLQQIIDVGGKVKVAAETVANIYNIGAKVHNALNKDGKTWPIIGEKKETPKIADEFTKFNLQREKQRWEWEQAARKKSEAEEASKRVADDAQRTSDRVAWERQKYK